MRHVDGEKKSCVCCGTPTTFVRDVRGPRGGHVRTERCCVDCGESNREPATSEEAVAA